MNYILVDQWCAHLWPEDLLHGILTAILKRDNGGGKATSQSWNENVYGGKGLDGGPSSKQMQDGRKLWKQIMSNSTATPLLDIKLRPVTKLPPVSPTHSITTHGANPFYVGEPLTSGGGMGKCRPFGNVLLNHMVLRLDVDHAPPKWPDAAEGRRFFSDIPAFLALEFHILEADPKNGRKVDLDIYSLLEENIVLQILGQFEPTLNTK
ncbi:hypothetical protein BJ875DRAFT_444062 [Amylocarpus encephaloides]|uniref:Uncharacterized protein n=1 Tax=Amylocarpus encephaloides TaxID=45428 RepID=A0A9P7YDP1_9HELO|nr:hypothetical protein BJ875DRAFT_444062 [Amylocarpus encephaloides]